MKPHRRTVQFTMMDPANCDGVFVADLSAESARLRKANVMHFGGRAAAYDARLSGDEFAVLLVAQTNGLRRNAGDGGNGRFKTGRLGSVEDLALPLRSARLADCESFRRCSARLSSLDRGEPLPEFCLDEVGVGEGQRVLGRQVLVDPARGLVGGLEIVRVQRPFDRAAPADCSAANTILAGRTNLPLLPCIRCRQRSFVGHGRPSTFADPDQLSDRSRFWRLRQDQARRDRPLRRCRPA